MSTFNATIDIGTRGSSLLTFDFYGCTGYNPSVPSTGYTYLTGCTLLQEDVSYTTMIDQTKVHLTGLTFDPIGSQIKYVRVEVNNIANGNAETALECQDLFQNIQITGIPTYTPTPVPATPTPTVTPVPATPTPTNTNTPLPATYTPTPTNTNTPTPTSTSTSPSNVTGSGYYGTTVEAACGDPATRISVNFTGNTDSFCTSTYFTGNTFASQTTGIYRLGYNGSYQTISLTFGSNVVQVTGGGCTSCGPTYTTVTVKSGTTVSDACDGTTITVKYTGTFAYDTTVLLDSGGTPVPDNYYYVVDGDYAGVVWIVDSVCVGCTPQAGNVHSLDICPTPPPYTTFLGYSSDPVTGGTFGVLAFDDQIDDTGYQVCNNAYGVIGGDPGELPWSFSVYGTNIEDATAMIELNSAFRGYLTTGQTFYIRQKISGIFKFRKFILDGDPSSSSVTATPQGVATVCPGP